jgi:hypothetical protein
MSVHESALIINVYFSANVLLYTNISHKYKISILIYCVHMIVNDGRVAQTV